MLALMQRTFRRQRFLGILLAGFLLITPPARAFDGTAIVIGAIVALGTLLVKTLISGADSLVGAVTSATAVEIRTKGDIATKMLQQHAKIAKTGTMAELAANSMPVGMAEDCKTQTVASAYAASGVGAWEAELDVSQRLAALRTGASPNAGGGGGGADASRLFPQFLVPELQTAALRDALCQGHMPASFVPKGLPKGVTCTEDKDLKILRYSEMLGQVVAAPENDEALGLHMALAVGPVSAPEKIDASSFNTPEGQDHIVKVMSRAVRESYGEAPILQSYGEIVSQTNDPQMKQRFQEIFEQNAAIKEKFPDIAKASCAKDSKGKDIGISRRCVLQYLASDMTFGGDFLSAAGDPMSKAVQLAAIRNMLLYEILTRTRVQSEIAGIHLVQSLQDQVDTKKLSTGGGGGGGGSTLDASIPMPQKPAIVPASLSVQSGPPEASWSLSDDRVTSTPVELAQTSDAQTHAAETRAVTDKVAWDARFDRLPGWSNATMVLSPVDKAAAAGERQGSAP